MKKLKNLKSEKELLYEKVQTIALDFNMSFVMDDINEKKEIIFYLNRNSNSYALRYDVEKDFFQIRILASRYSGNDDRLFNFPTIEGCMECLSAIDFYYEQIIRTTQYF